VLFNSDFFKAARFSKIKSPAELVVGTLRLAGGEKFPSPGIGTLVMNSGYMGQELLNPPSVEGWHTGVEWINSGTLMNRINFAAGTLSDLNRPGVKAIMRRLQVKGDLTPEEFVDGCLDLIGPLEVKTATRQQLVDHATERGNLGWETDQAENASSDRVGEMLKLIASSREYQYS